MPVKPTHSVRLILSAILIGISVSLSAKVIYETDYVAISDPEQKIWSDWSGGHYTTTMPDWNPKPTYTSAYLTSASDGYCNIRFDNPISLHDYTNVKIIIDYGSGSSRPLSLGINTTSATQIHSMGTDERSKVISVTTDVSVDSIKSVYVKSKSGSGAYFFHIAIVGKEIPKLKWSDGLNEEDTVTKYASSADFTYTAIPLTESTGSITYSSSQESIATIDATTGLVHLTGNYGITTITATQAAIDTFPSTYIVYYLQVLETKIIEQSTGPIYYDDHNSSEFCFQDSSHCLQEYVYPIYVIAEGATGYQWQQSTDGSNWTNMQDSTSSSFLPYIPRALDDSVITYYRCEVLGASSPLYSDPVKVIVEPAKGCYPNHRIETTVISKNALEVTGTMIDYVTTECNLEGNTADFEGKTGYKMGFDKAHVGVTLTGRYTFQPGDIVRVFITRVGDYGSLGGYGDSTLHIYSSMDGDSTKHIGSIDGLRQGWNEWYLPKSVGNIKTICLFRHGKSNDSVATNQNHWIYELQVVRLEDCYDCAEKDPTITIHAKGTPPTLFADTLYQIEGSLEGALSGYWTEKSDASKFGDVRSPKTTIKFNEAGTYTITWTVSDTASHNRWGCRKYTEKEVEVFKAFPIELHSSCAHKISQRPDSVSPTHTVTYKVDGCTDVVGKYMEKDQLHVTAVPDDSCVVFTKWSDDITTNPRMFKVSEISTIKPIFEYIKYTVEATVEPEDKGEVTLEKKEE